jgi:HSP90 family molecular chaperone
MDHSMDQEKLHQKLESLQTALHEADELDEESRALLEEIDGDIHQILNKEPDDVSILDRLKDTVQDFEEEHPQLTITLDKIINMLSRMGI